MPSSGDHLRPEYRPCTHTLTPRTLPWNHCCKTPHQIPPGWDPQFSGHYPLASHFAWQSDRAIPFYSIQNSVSEIQSSTSAQGLSFIIIHSMGLDKCIMTCIHHYSIIQNSLTALKFPVLCCRLFFYRQYWVRLRTFPLFLVFKKFLL